MRKQPPAYRKRKGTTQALVTLTDSATQRRRDYRLGEFGTPAGVETGTQLVGPGFIMAPDPSTLDASPFRIQGYPKRPGLSII